ncbi:MAG: hypothetical protein ACFFD2_16220 [Promethearchaeota archaeon]
MSEVTDAKTSLKKIISLIEELSGISIDSIPKLSEQPKEMLELVVKLEEEQKANLEQTESNTDQINSLKNKISQNTRDISNLDEEIMTLNEEKRKFLNKNESAQNELIQKQEQIKMKKDELNNRTTRLKELDEKVEKLAKIIDRADKTIKELQDKLQEDFDKKYKFVSSFGNRLEAMRLLIKKQYIQSSELAIIQALTKDRTLGIDSMIQSLGIKDDFVKKVLRKMVEKNGPIEFDETNGTVLLKEEVNLI